MQACTTITPTQYKTYITTLLTAADPCAPQDLFVRVGLWWDLMGMQSGCDSELRYLLTQREGLKYLMGCAAHQVDQSDSKAQSLMNSKATTRQDGWSQAQQTNQSTTFADAVGQDRYNDFSNASSDATSSQDSQSEAHDRSSACMHDVGHGESLVENNAKRDALTFANSNSFSDSENSTTGFGKRNGCNYSFSRSETLGRNFAIFSGQAGHTETNSAWQMYTNNETETFDRTAARAYNESHAHSEGGSNSTSQRTSNSYFNALVDDSSSSSTQAHSESHSQSAKDAKSHAEGLGQGANESKSRGEQSAQATNQAHADGEQHRLTTRTAFATMDSAKLHQRFEHLKAMYDQVTSQIEYKRMILKSGSKMAYSAMTTFAMDCCAPIAIGRPCHAC